jgi:hypothetical protein
MRFLIDASMPRSTVRHPNVASVFHGKDRRRYFYAMEFVEADNELILGGRRLFGVPVLH